MAKSGLTYYNVDTDRYQDKRIKKLKKNNGCVGLAVYDYIVCECYRVNGWGMEYDEDVVFDIADYLNIKEIMVTEVVRYCAFVGLFDEGLLGCGIITSEDIQLRYLEICKRSKRVTASIPQEYRLYHEDLQKTTEDAVKTTEDLQKTTEDAVKTTEDATQNKIKENKIKENKRVCDNAHTCEDTQEDSIFSKFINWCKYYAPLAIQFKEPLTEEQFNRLYQIFGAKKLKQCAKELHNKEACLRLRNAEITWIDWLQRIH